MTPQELARNVRKYRGAEKVGVRKDGTVVVRRSYFYRNDMNPQSYAADVVSHLNAFGIKCHLVGAEDQYAYWPKTSYFAALLRAE